MSIPEPQWISTASMNRFYDHCYLIECAYHIISRYCCSFTNLLTHDDGSIPYYLVQKVKIAVEYGKILLNSRYRPFQHQLRILGVYDYIDRPQYEKLCTLWNTIKAETQIVEMYFNQISLLIYPVVSSTTLPFLESVDNEDVSALIKINAIIHTLINYDETTSAATLKKNVSCLLRSDSRTPSATPYINEEELGVFIVNSIIEPLFDEEESSNPLKSTGATKDNPRADSFLADSLLVPPKTCEKGGNVGSTAKVLRGTSSKMSNFELGRINQLQMLKNNWLTNDFYSIFKMEDPLLLTNILSGSRVKGDKGGKFHDGRAGEPTKKFVRAGDNFRGIRYDGQKRATFQRKYPKKCYDKKFAYGNYEMNKKFGSNFTTPLTPSPIVPDGSNKNFV